MARRAGWKVILRIEDLDSPRTKPHADRDAIECLRWLGLDWDEGPVYQSHDLSPYIQAMQRLAEHGTVFPSELSRAEIASAASAPHPEEPGHEVRFAPELRPHTFPMRFDPTIDAGWRFTTPTETVQFDDLFLGRVAARPSATIGDFIVWTKSRVPAYQLAVVVDDHRQGVTHVIRGADLADSAGRQLLLYRALGLRPEPVHGHLPLIRGADGRRLAKRHGDTRIAQYRARGAAPESVIGYLAWSAGVLHSPRPMSAREFAAAFDPDTMPRTDWTFAPDHERWMLPI